MIVRGTKGENMKEKPYLIYALLAFSSDGTRKACHIDFTNNIDKRLGRHRRTRPERLSQLALFDWARLEQAKIAYAALVLVRADPVRVVEIKNQWARLALADGFLMPDFPGLDPEGRDTWYARFPVQAKHWPSQEINLVSVLLENAEKSCPILFL